MLILTSNGITSNELFDRVKQAIGRRITTIALIPTASANHPEKTCNIIRHSKDLEALGMKVSVINIEEDDCKELDSYEALFLMGGNPFYLLDAIRKNKCEEVLRRFAKDKLVIGTSAGSMMFGDDIGLVYELHPYQNNGIELDDFTCLGVTKYNVYSHFSHYAREVDGFLDKMNEYEKKKNLKFTGLEDGQGLIIDGDLVELI